MSLSIAPLYGGVLGLLFAGLSFRVIRARQRFRITLGDGGNRMLMRRLRVQANFAEYVPMVVLLMVLAELQGTPAWVLHGVGAVLLVGRSIHAYGVSQEPETIAVRAFGMALTMTALITAALANLGLALRALLGAG